MVSHDGHCQARSSVSCCGDGDRLRRDLLRDLLRNLRDGLGGCDSRTPEWSRQNSPELKEDDGGGGFAVGSGGVAASSDGFGVGGFAFDDNNNNTFFGGCGGGGCGFSTTTAVGFGTAFGSVDCAFNVGRAFGRGGGRGFGAGGDSRPPEPEGGFGAGGDSRTPEPEAHDCELMSAINFPNLGRICCKNSTKFCFRAMRWTTPQSCGVR